MEMFDQIMAFKLYVVEYFRTCIAQPRILLCNLPHCKYYDHFKLYVSGFPEIVTVLYYLCWWPIIQGYLPAGFYSIYPKSVTPEHKNCGTSLDKFKVDAGEEKFKTCVNSFQMCRHMIS